MDTSYASLCDALTDTDSLISATALQGAQEIADQVIAEILDDSDISEIQGQGTAQAWADAISLLVSGEDGYGVNDVVAAIEKRLAN